MKETIGMKSFFGVEQFSQGVYITGNRDVSLPIPKGVSFLSAPEGAVISSYCEPGEDAWVGAGRLNRVMCSPYIALFFSRWVI